MTTEASREERASKRQSREAIPPPPPRAGVSFLSSLLTRDLSQLPEMESLLAGYESCKSYYMKAPPTPKLMRCCSQLISLPRSVLRASSPVRGLRDEPKECHVCVGRYQVMNFNLFQSSISHSLLEPIAQIVVSIVLQRVPPMPLQSYCYDLNRW